MPTYEYECDACGHRFEEFQSMSAAALEKCPECKKKKLRRLIGGGAAILFKGSGFYETDYRSSSYHEGAKAESGSSPSESSGSTEAATPKPTSETKSNPVPSSSKAKKKGS
ncbi:MAG: zinc ribbon domain-containing protein [Planctomycetes bacterium]|nr:zinc ribbon domain-containing protein [Planctomycetota bacterium]MCB9918864.1 zinc ribbon domain-containing protein [Planctomycetota bacterium]